MGGLECFVEDAPYDSRWRVLLQSGCREGEELRSVWRALQEDEEQAAAWLDREMQENLARELEGVGGCSTNGSTRGKLAEERDTLPGDHWRWHHDSATALTCLAAAIPVTRRRRWTGRATRRRRRCSGSDRCLYIFLYYTCAGFTSTDTLSVIHAQKMAWIFQQPIASCFRSDEIFTLLQSCPAAPFPTIPDTFQLGLPGVDITVTLTVSGLCMPHPPPAPPLLTPPSPGVSVGRPRLQQSSSQAGRPPPPVRREEGPGPREELEPSSNSSTPRGSLEFLPPPPPHLLCSDEEEAGQVLGPAEEQHQLSVADSTNLHKSPQI